jgi:putative addiction module component (TIGR02574 family)
MAYPARLLEEALSLDPEQRARIARRLIGSLEEPDADAEALWRQEIRRRIDAIEAGTAELEDWETVRGRVRAAIES